MANDAWQPGFAIRHSPSVIDHPSSSAIRAEDSAMPTFEGDYSPPAGRFAIVVARFNGLITESLLDGCRDTLARHGVGDDRVDVAWVPGSFEIPSVAKHLAGSGKYVAVIC